MADPVRIVTHNGGFHADDVFAAATIFLSLEREGKEYEITRTRDEALIEKADIVFDVGGIYDPEKDRFDHHQKGGAGVGANNIPFASFGLVWQKYGEKLAGSKEVAEGVNKLVVQPIDAFDNGVDLYTTTVKNVWPLTINTIVGFYNTGEEGSEDGNFLALVAFAKEILLRAITTEQVQRALKKTVHEAYENAKQKSFLVFDTPQDRIALQIALQDYHDVFFVAFPHKKNNDWRLIGLVDDINSFVLRKALPASWAGLRDEELEKATGIEGSRFCHNGRFLAVADTKEAILALADSALRT